MVLHSKFFKKGDIFSFFIEERSEMNIKLLGVFNYSYSDKLIDHQCFGINAEKLTFAISIDQEELKSSFHLPASSFSSFSLLSTLTLGYNIL